MAAENFDIIIVNSAGRKKRTPSEDNEFLFTSLEAKTEVRVEDPADANHFARLQNDDLHLQADADNFLDLEVSAVSDPDGTLALTNAGFTTGDLSSKTTIGDNGIDVDSTVNNSQFLVDFTDVDFILTLNKSGSDVFQVRNDGRAVITDAVNNDEAVTLGQVNTLIAAGVPTENFASAAAIADRRVVRFDAAAQMEQADKSDTEIGEGTKFSITDGVTAGGGGDDFFVEGATVDGLSGLVVGDPVYLGASGALVTSLAGFVSGDNVVRIGYAKSTTELELDPSFLFQF